MKNLNVFIEGLHKYLGDAIRPTHMRVNDLEQRIKTLEDEAQQRSYQGVWEDGREYLKHNATTRDGSLWICLEESTTERPGDGLAWQLAVKKGRDAR